MSKIVNFHPAEAPTDFRVLRSFNLSEWLIIHECTDDFHTYQMALLDKVWEEGATVRIWYQDQDGYMYDEFRYGMVLPSGKMLRKEHSLLRLWMASGLGEHLRTGYTKEVSQ